ncbi:5-formyltetrahydrofolate cyclo-ligase [Collinsella tanakaei]|uniref:5-formyltetrahydrofolate cyclo-ligase n=1 Tax=Collinsella tanakaei TaxID=626935 RepID=UPI0019592EE2|nr:5-formyltetrahydrofolate cyclo-ligase [Collinsella tanakaei]MBM6755744.1 5-formyltetrahydrofolate cyclo-ligase [Collinsella tanakaei]
MSGACDKGATRRSALQARDALSPADRHAASQRICAQLVQVLADLPATARPTVAMYAAMRSEVGLDTFILAAYGRGCRVAFPCMQHAGTGQTTCMRTVTEREYRSKTVPFINHPVAARDADTALDARFPVVAPADIDLIVVPLVAYDAQGNRLGYGGGNYDRYLAQVRPGCRIIGVAFAAQQVDRVPTEPHDHPLPRIISA